MLRSPTNSRWSSVLNDELRTRLTALIEEGRDIAHSFDLEVRQKNWHPFIPANYDDVLNRLLGLYSPGMSFLEFGSATGVITIMADLIGFDAYGIELDGDLVRIAHGLAAKYGSNATFAQGSFLPTGYVYRDSTGDERLGTLGIGESGFIKLGRALEDFDLVFAYPWDGEGDVIEDVMKQYGGSNSRLLLYGGVEYEIVGGKRRRVS